jgi:Cu(I)/Ag(I) efflux system membrane fusion protein
MKKVLIVLGLVLVFWAGQRFGPALGERWDNWSASDEQDGTGDPAYYTCGMHPWIVLPDPGLCPICHMDLEAIDPSRFTGEVSIDPVVVQNIGVRVAEVTAGPLTRRLRTVGTVDWDETTLRDVNTKVDGWIEALHVDSLGAPVTVGQPLFELYSPALYEAQEEFLLALEGQGRLASDATSAQRARAAKLVEDSRTRLAYYDLLPEQIDAIAERRTAAKALTILSPHQGVVIEKMAIEGMRVEPGMRVYRMADPKRVWVLATLYEDQVPFVEVGQKATMRLPYVPGVELEGTVLFVYPYLERATRQVRVRLAFDNESGLLKPGMFATVEIARTLAAERTLAPREAVIDTGERQVAFVSLGEGRFEPRDVRTGVAADDGRVEVLSGLKPGEKVVVSGQFLLDSEAKIRAALAKMVRGEPAVAGPEAAVGDLVVLPSTAADALTSLLEAAFAIGAELADDRAEHLADPARSAAAACDTLLATAIPEHPHFWHEHEELATARGAALRLAGTDDIEAARLAYADLSVALATLVDATGVPSGVRGPVEELHCPMYREGQGGGLWLQPAGEVRNPYFGAVMRTCFDRRRDLPRSVAPRAGNMEAGDGR